MMSHEAIGLRLGLTEAQVRTIEKNALVKIRFALLRKARPPDFEAPSFECEPPLPKLGVFYD